MGVTLGVWLIKDGVFVRALFRRGIMNSLDTTSHTVHEEGIELGGGVEYCLTLARQHGLAGTPSHSLPPPLFLSPIVSVRDKVKVFYVSLVAGKSDARRVSSSSVVYKITFSSFNIFIERDNTDTGLN